MLRTESSPFKKYGFIYYPKHKFANLLTLEMYTNLFIPSASLFCIFFTSFISRLGLWHWKSYISLWGISMQGLMILCATFCSVLGPQVGFCISASDLNLWLKISRVQHFIILNVHAGLDNFVCYGLFCAYLLDICLLWYWPFIIDLWAWN